ncbi:MAG: hypothetical protein H6719_06645 [Sandaracinaceae bacterium]|nr:hypothetical protein [Sandaracinaceae bacterium]
MPKPPDSSFVPVNGDLLEGLVPALHRVERAAVAQRAALARLLELADDLRADAVARLRERGASEAQVERYEGAFQAQSRATVEGGAALDAALGGLAKLVAEVVDG